MPRVSSAMINVLIERFEQHDSIVIPECNGRLFHPRIIPRRYFAEFLTLSDDTGGMSVIERHSAGVVKVAVGREDDYVDIDTPDDFEALS